MGADTAFLAGNRSTGGIYTTRQPYEKKHYKDSNPTVNKPIPKENEGLYQAAFNAQKERGCPTLLASEAATIVATDEPGKPNLGRSVRDQYVIWEAFPYLQNEVNNG